MRHQEITYGATGQSFYFDPPEGQATGTPTVSVFPSDTDDTGTAETATTGSCSVDSVSTTLGGAASEGDESISVASASGIVKGRRYLLTNEAGESEWVEVKSISSTTIGLRRPLLNDQTTSSTFKGCRISVSVNSTWVADLNNLTEWEAGHAGYRLRWSYVVGGVGYVAMSFADLVRYTAKNLVTAVDVDQRFPGWIDRLPLDDRENQGAALVEEAFHAVRMDALGDSIALRRMRNAEVLRELVIHRAAQLAVEAAAIAGASNEAAVKTASEAYQRRYNQLIREPKVPIDPSGDGASGAAQRLAVWRR